MKLTAYDHFLMMTFSGPNKVFTYVQFYQNRTLFKTYSFTSRFIPKVQENNRVYVKDIWILKLTQTLNYKSSVHVLFEFVLENKLSSKKPLNMPNQYLGYVIEKFSMREHFLRFQLVWSKGIDLLYLRNSLTNALKTYQIHRLQQQV